MAPVQGAAGGMGLERFQVCEDTCAPVPWHYTAHALAAGSHPANPLHACAPPPLITIPTPHPHPRFAQTAGPARREAYEAKWAALEALPPDQPLHFSDIPWVVEPGAPNSELFRAIVLHGVSGGPAGVRTRLRSEVLRWHPDKFEARWGRRLAGADAARVLAGVRETAQQLTQLMAAK